MSEVEEKAKRLIEVVAEKDELKREEESLKAYFEKLATEKLQDTKNKTVAIETAQGVVTVTNAEEVKVFADRAVEKLLGVVASDFITKKESYTYSAPFKRLLIAAFKEDFLKESLASVVESLTEDEKIRKVLCKKLRGNNFEKDKAVLLANGLSEETANDGAFWVAESVNYERLKSIVESAEFEGGFEAAVAKLKASVIVEEKMKVSVEARNE